MSILTELRNRFLGKLVPYGGTISTVSDNDTYPIALQNEINGGHHGYKTLEELAQLPIDRINRPMHATVLQHVRPDTTIFKRTTFVFAPTSDQWEALKSSGYDRISEIPSYDLSLYWKIDSDVSDFEGTLETQYAPSVDYGLGPGQPAFQLPTISKANYNSGYKSNADLTEIWDYTFNPAIHKWQRQRFGATSDWGIPVQVIGEGYTAGDYIDNRFIWVLKDTVPLKPATMVGGRPNNEPSGWLGDPSVPGGIDYYTYILTYDLFRINAPKTVYGVLKNEWSTPVKISTDPLLVRYGFRPASRDFINPDDSDTTDWRGYYTPKQDTQMATRPNALSTDWEIIMIDNEEGEYVDYIFKAFPIGYEIIEADRPTIALPFSDNVADYPNNDWKDFPFAVGEKEVLHRSVSRKYNNGDLKSSGWSFPIRNDGVATIMAIIEPQGATVFKYDEVGAVTPTTLNLKAVLYKGIDEVTPDVVFKWYKGIKDPGNLIVKGSSVGPSQYHTISGTQNELLTVSNEAVNDSQVYTIKAVFAGEDYYDHATIVDVTDSQGYMAVIEATSGFVFKNQVGTKAFTGKLYLNGSVITDGVTYQWFRDALDITPVVGATNQVSVTGGDFTSQAVLKLIVSKGGASWTWTETLSDVEDGKSVLIQYAQVTGDPIEGDWNTNPVNAVWMRVSVDGGVTWGAAIKVKGESAAYNGGFQKNVFKLSVSQPTASGLTSGLLPSQSGWQDSPMNPTATESVWMSTLFFAKNPATTSVALTSANWTAIGSWSTPIKALPNQEALGGPAGATGIPGWAPIPAVETYVEDGLTKSNVKIVDWTNPDGSANPSTKPPINQYLGPLGMVPYRSQASNIIGPRGLKGLTGADGSTKMWGNSNIRTTYISDPNNVIVDLGSSASRKLSIIGTVDLWKQGNNADVDTFTLTVYSSNTIAEYGPVRKESTHKDNLKSGYTQANIHFIGTYTDRYFRFFASRNDGSQIGSIYLEVKQLQ